jgi:DNA gyrase subunit A
MEVASALMERALGTDAFTSLQAELGITAVYRMTEAQAEAVVRLQLGQLAALESDEILKEYNKLRAEIREHETLLSDDANIRAVIRADLLQMRDRYGDARRTEISDAESDVDMEDLIEDEQNVVSITHEGFMKRMPLTEYRVQGRGGKGVQGGLRENDFVEHFFTASTKDYLLCFSDKGQVYWLKVYKIPEASRTSPGRSIANVLSLKPEEKISGIVPIREFVEGSYLLTATRKGLIKKTKLTEYSRPRQGGIIGMGLDENDILISVGFTRPGDEVVLSTRNGMAIRFSEADVRSTGRGTYGVKGVRLVGDDELVGMVVADPEGYLLTVCELGYGKRTPFGANEELTDIGAEDSVDEPGATEESRVGRDAESSESPVSRDAESSESPVSRDAESSERSAEESDETDDRSSMRYRRQRRGGKGVKDVRVTAKNGKVMGIASVRDGDEIMLITMQGMGTRSRVDDIRIVGRNTQGVRVMNLSEGDRLASLAKIAPENVAGDAAPPAPESEPPA